MVQNPDINANDQKLNANNGFSLDLAHRQFRYNDPPRHQLSFGVPTVVAKAALGLSPVNLQSSSRLNVVAFAGPVNSQLPQFREVGGRVLTQTPHQLVRFASAKVEGAANK